MAAVWPGTLQSAASRSGALGVSWLEGGKRAAQVGFCPLGVTQLVGIPCAAASRSHRAGLGMRGRGEKGLDPGVAAVHGDSMELGSGCGCWRWDAAWVL